MAKHDMRREWMAAYYNEIEPYAAQWLRNLIAKGLIPDGEVDTRSIVNVQPDDLRGFKQAHFFAGIGGWGYALRLAGWPDDHEVWTGSCPCQPFSVAGKGLGTDDPRHLWPHFFRLIRARRPAVIMGEQVAGAAGYGWLDGVAFDLESEDYAIRGVDIPACAVDAPHIRSRLYWVASDMADAARKLPHGSGREGRGRSEHTDSSRSGLDNADDTRLERHGGHEPCSAQGRGEPSGPFAASGVRGDMADAKNFRREEWARQDREQDARSSSEGGLDAAGDNTGDMADAGQVRRGRWRKDTGSETWPDAGIESRSCSFWSDHIWLTGADGKARRSQPGLPLLAHGVSARVGRLRAYGNAIVPQLAAEVISAYMEQGNEV